jgi:hypothetical protein
MRWIAPLVSMACLLIPGLAGAIGDSAALIDQRMSRMEEALDLSGEQILEIRVILEQTFAEIAFAREEAGDDLEVFLRSARERLEGSDARIEALLGEEQKKDFEAFKKTRRAELATLHYRERLELSEEQTAGVYAVLLEADRQREKLRGQGEGGAGAVVGGRAGRGGNGRRGRGGGGELRALREETDDRIEALLTVEQVAEFRQLREEQRQRMQERRGSGREQP